MPVVKSFNFITDVEPIMHLELPDRTRIDITPCTKREYADFVKRLKEITRASQAEDLTEEEANKIINDCYECAAYLMNHNTAKIDFTAEDLKKKHDITDERLISFFYAYADYTNSIYSLKN